MMNTSRLQKQLHFASINESRTQVDRDYKVQHNLFNVRHLYAKVSYIPMTQQKPSVKQMDGRSRSLINIHGKTLALPRHQSHVQQRNNHFRQRSQQDLNALYNSYKSQHRRHEKSPLSNQYMQVGRHPLPKLMQDVPTNSDDCDASLSEHQNDLAAKYEKYQNFENVELFNNPYIILSKSPKY